MSKNRVMFSLIGSLVFLTSMVEWIPVGVAKTVPAVPIAQNIAARSLLESQIAGFALPTDELNQEITEPYFDAPGGELELQVVKMGTDFVKLSGSMDKARKIKFTVLNGVRQTKTCKGSRCKVVFTAGKNAAGSTLKIRATALGKGKKKLDHAYIDVTLGQPMVDAQETGSNQKNSVVNVTWSKVSGAAGYQIERCDELGIECKTLETVSASNDAELTDFTAAQGAPYNYRVTPYTKANSKKTLLKSATGDVAVTTKASVSAQAVARHNALLQLQQPNLLKGLLLLSPQDNYQSPINGILIPGGAVKEYYPYVKFIWTGKAGSELEIHLFLNFVDLGGRKKGDPTFSSYKSKFLAGLKKYYNKIAITKHAGDWNGANVHFTTKLVTHVTTNMPNQASQQQYIQVQIGGENNWYTTFTDIWYGTRGSAFVKMPYPSHIKASLRKNSGTKRISSVAAHEIGHALGLNDAYRVKKGNSQVDRMAENSETTRDTRKQLKSGAKWANLMKYDWQAKSITGNDLEMILTSYSNAFNGLKNAKNRIESYRAYTNGTTWQISAAIANRDDKLKH